MKNIDICIAGLGNVGSSLVNLIEQNANYVINKSNLNINILALSAKNKNKKRNFNIDNYEFIENPIDLLKVDNKTPNILIELIGYEKDISYELVKLALNQKIHVITGNKAMLAKYGQELFKIAEKIKFCYCLKQL